MTTSIPRRLVVALALALVASTAITPALAASDTAMFQSQPPTQNNSTTSPAPNTTTSTRSHWTDNSTSGGAFGGMIDIPDPTDATAAAVNYIAEWLIEQTTGLFKALLNAFTSFIVGTPYPVNQGAYGVFGLPVENPGNGQSFWHEGFYKFYIPVTGGLSMFALVFTHLTSGIKATLVGYRRDTIGGFALLKKTLLSAVFIGVWWQLGTAIAMVNNELALWIAPTGEQLISSASGILKISSGTLLAILFTKTLGATEMAILAIIYATRHALVVLYQYTMPLLIVLTLTFPTDRGRRFFGSLAWHYVTVLITVYPAAVLMKLGFVIDAGFGFGDIGNALVSMGFLGAAILSVGILGWTSVATRRFAGKMGTAATEGTPSKESVEHGYERVRERTESVTQRVQNRAGGLRSRLARNDGSASSGGESGGESESTSTQSRARRGTLRGDGGNRSSRTRSWDYSAPSNRGRPGDGDD